MKQNIILLFIIIIFAISFSCKEERLKSKDKIEYYRIKLTSDQIREIGQSRILTLNEEQLRYVKNKIRKFHVGGPNYFAPEGWFYANWIKPDEVVIQKHLIDKFENLIDSSKFKSVNQSKNVFINIDINGNFYYNDKKITIERIKQLIDNLLIHTKPYKIGIYISYAPIENAELIKKVLDQVNSLKTFYLEKNVFFQDNL